MANPMPPVDILIVGGGLTGATLMLALANLGYRMLMVETKPFSKRISADFDARSLALSPASIRILNMLSIWPLLNDHATAIQTIHVSQQGSFGQARLHASLQNPLGHIVEMQHINRALKQLLKKQPMIAPATLIELNSDTNTALIQTADEQLTVQAKLIIAADGTDSSTRNLCGLAADVKEYSQKAIITNIGLTRTHHNMAFERFTSLGPLALLPMTSSRASLVWCLSPEEAERLMTCPEPQFIKELQLAFGYRLGRFAKVGRRVLYPLKQVLMPKQVFKSIVFVGNAAHTLHPVAGQGFNLGLRDVATLAQCIAKEGFGSDMLNTYQKARQHDQATIMGFTDRLIELFGCQAPGFRFARSIGLMTMDNARPLKNLLVRYAGGFAGINSDLVCGIPLNSQEHE